MSGITAPAARFVTLLAQFTAANAIVLAGVFLACGAVDRAGRAVIATTLFSVFIALAIVSAFAAWRLVQAQDRRLAAERAAIAEADRLRAEIAAHAATEAALAKARETEIAALAKARDTAEAANLAKSRYLVGVSHEIRSPLNAIYGYAQLLERAHGIAPAEAGGVIRRASEHLTNIVDGLLDISRIESGVLKLNRDIVPLPAFLDGLVTMFRREAEEKGLAFHYDAPANLPAFVRTDEKRLRQILINLLSNAIKYTPSGHAALKVRYRGMVADFEISDTGIGIAPADRERIFEAFDRGSSAAALAQPGTGLGLAITRVLAQVMGGDIGVTSSPAGSTFRLRLLLGEPNAPPPATARRRQISGYAGTRRTILLIDDDPAQLAVLQGLLRPLGFHVFAAAGGAEGIDLALRCTPDLVLLDIQMPGLSGWDVARRLRAIDSQRRLSPGGQPLQILLVSANAHEFAAGGDGGAAHDGFILKPVALEALLDAVALRLDLAWEADAAPLPIAASVAGLGGDRVAELRRLGQVGHIRGIEARLEAIVADDPASHALVEELRRHLRAFDIKAYLKLLESVD